MRTLTLLSLIACATPTSSDVQPVDPQSTPEPLAALEDTVGLDGLMSHLDALQQIADDNGGNRAVGYPGFTASTDYAAQVLEDAGYEVVRTPFSFQRWSQDGPTVVEVPGDVVFEAGVQVAAMSYSPGGDVTAPVTAVDLVLPPTVDPSSTSGCEVSDFDGFPAGNIALIQRGDCFFQQKVDRAIDAGASAVIVFNEGQNGRRALEPWQLDAEAANTIPVVSANFSTGEQLALALEGGRVTVHIVVDAAVVETEAENVIAQTPGGDLSNVLVVGGHIDSVPQGPGINDNGTGVAMILELAIQVAAQPVPPKNPIRFALWGGEELGLLGSSDYVSNLDDDALDTILANLNFDMLASPNGAPMIYDGDGSDFGLPGPSGSDDIEDAFQAYFDNQSLDVITTVFDGRSDYYGFIQNGIPAGGLFAGADGTKGEEESMRFGGQPGQVRDSCYHQACDTVDNIDPGLFEQLAKAAAYATWTLANGETTWAEQRRLQNPGPLEVPVGGCHHTLTRL